jgi:VCBS repeat-containing protein
LVDVNVTLTNLSHTYPDDIDIIPVGPAGQNTYLMSDAGTGNDVVNVTLTFDDAAADYLPDSSQIVAGTYKPTNYGTPDTFPAPAPAGPYGTLLSAFNGTDPTGNWNLFVYDDAGGDLGSISGGWSLELTYATAPGVTLTDTLPAGFTLLYGYTPGWSCGLNGQLLTCTSPTMPVGSSTLELYGTAPASTGYITNTVEIATATALDPNPNNNAAAFPILVDTAPLAADDSYSTAEDTPLAVAAPGVLANDSDPDGDPLEAALVTDVSNGTLAFNADGSFTYTPDLNYNGPDQFTYSAGDGYLTTTATVSLDVTPVNDAPVAVNDSYSTAEDTPLVVSAPGVLTNDNDVDGDPLAAALVSDVSNGTLALNVDGSFTYTPDANYNGPDQFTYSAGDGLLADEATVVLNVTAVNDDPVAADDAYNTNEDTVLIVIAPGVLSNDSDVDGDPLQIVGATAPLHGEVEVFLDGAGGFMYTPTLNYNGPDVFTYTVSDGVSTDVAGWPSPLARSTTCP